MPVARCGDRSRIVVQRLKYVPFEFSRLMPVVLTYRESDRSTNPQALDAIERHVNEQPYRRQSQHWDNNCDSIDHDGGPTVQGVEPYATSIGVKNRVGQKMVDVHHHCRNHHQPGHFPSILEQHSGDHARYETMQQEMYACTQHGLHPYRSDLLQPFSLNCEQTPITIYVLNKH